MLSSLLLPSLQFHSFLFHSFTCSFITLSLSFPFAEFTSLPSLLTLPSAPYLTLYYPTFTFAVQRIGCFKDTSRRAIPQLDGKSPLLKGNYQRRKTAIEKCAYTAIRYGYAVFGVQNGGQCFSGPRAHRTYAKYGRSNRCRNGKGGPWANDVYRVIGIRQTLLKRISFSIHFSFTPEILDECVHPLRPQGSPFFRKKYIYCFTFGLFTDDPDL